MSFLNGWFKMLVLYTSEEIDYICTKVRNKPIIHSSCLTSIVGDSINNTLKIVCNKDAVTTTSYRVTKITINIYIKRRHSQDLTNLLDYLSSVLVQCLTGTDISALSIFIMNRCLKDMHHSVFVYYWMSTEHHSRFLEEKYFENCMGDSPWLLNPLCTKHTRI